MAPLLLEDEPVPPDQLLLRALRYAQIAGCTQATMDDLAAFVRDPITAAILALPAEALGAYLVNDAYKPRMHKLYARYMPGVVADFELAVRRTPVPLAAIRREDPELWQLFQQACSQRLGVPPYPPPVVQALNTRFAGFQCSEAMLARGGQHGVAPVSWQELGGELVAFSHGPIEAASHAETTLTQLVQAATLAAQVRRLVRQHGVRLSSTELLANSLAKLAAGVQRLAEEAAAQAAQAASDDSCGAGGQPPAMMLFAGRRSSSRRYLLLQNWYCIHHLPGYAGTSSVLAVVVLERLLREQRQLQQCQQQQEQQQQQWQHQDQREQQQGQGNTDLRLVGTLAHEVMMVTDQLLGCFDDLHPNCSSKGDDAGGGGRSGSRGGETGAATAGGSPTQICSLLAHLLLLAAGGGVHQATALADTFGTRGFVGAALAARLPEEFRRDMQEQYPDQWAALSAAVRARGALCFDLFSTWRMDSGSYEDMAEYLAAAWERRWKGVLPERRAPRPRFMHSNLESFDEIVAMWRLPPRIRPVAFAFGTLADGFLPFDTPGLHPSATCAGGEDPAPPPQQGQQQAAGEQGSSSGGDVARAGGGGAGGGGGSSPSGGRVELKMCSVVMKAVQARHPGGGAGPCSTESAGKIGDDAAHGKMQFDRRLPPEAVERTRRRLLLLAEACQVDTEAASAALARAYHAVTRDGVLR